MTAAAAVEPTELEELMKAQAEAAHEREVGDATRPTAEDLAASPTRIDVEGLDLFYGDHHALKDVNIKIRDKQITSFIGPSGCGKSTLLRCFNRMNDGIKDCRIEGKIALDGQDILGDYDICRLRQRVGMVFQRPNPFPMSIYDNVAYGPRGMGVRDRVVLDELVEDSLRRAALWDEAKDKLKESGLGLSGGQQQRLCIARALAVQPDILLMDEPTSALDPEMVQEVLDVMIELAQEDITMICVTHEMGFARQVADRVIFMEDGRILERARPSTSSITPRTRVAASSCPRFCTRRGDGHDGYDEGGRVAPSLFAAGGRRYACADGDRACRLRQLHQRRGLRQGV